MLIRGRPAKCGDLPGGWVYRCRDRAFMQNWPLARIYIAYTAIVFIVKPGESAVPPRAMSCCLRVFPAQGRRHNSKIKVHKKTLGSLI